LESALSDESEPEPAESQGPNHVVSHTPLGTEALRTVVRDEPLPIEIARISGQWLGRYGGTSSGTLLIDLDDMGAHFEGRVCAYEDNTALPSILMSIKTTEIAASFCVRLKLFPIDPRTSEPTTWNQLVPLFPNVVFPDYADADFSLGGQTLKVSCRTNIETFGSAEITRSRPNAPTEYEPLPDVTNWEQFKAYVGRLEYRRYIFRGQDKPLRLRTSFHRTGRSDLTRFLTEDVKTLHRHLSLRTSHVFNLNIADENGAFLNLVQHHGYPTPLLDWTFSPFVGAFFAYHGLKNSEASRANDTEKIRMFIFDQKEWRERYPQIPKLTPLRPHFSVLEFIAMDNERMIPQQSISTVTNIDDIESYIRSAETADYRFLR
jgi:hypothetical protein